MSEKLTTAMLGGGGATTTGGPGALLSGGGSAAFSARTKRQNENEDASIVVLETMNGRTLFSYAFLSQLEIKALIPKVLKLVVGNGVMFG